MELEWTKVSSIAKSLNYFFFSPISVSILNARKLGFPYLHTREKWYIISSSGAKRKYFSTFLTAGTNEMCFEW